MPLCFQRAVRALLPPPPVPRHPLDRLSSAPSLPSHPPSHPLNPTQPKSPPRSLVPHPPPLHFRRSSPTSTSSASRGVGGRVLTASVAPCAPPAPYRDSRGSYTAREKTRDKSSENSAGRDRGRWGWESAREWKGGSRVRTADGGVRLR